MLNNTIKNLFYSITLLIWAFPRLTPSVYGLTEAGSAQSPASGVSSSTNVLSNNVFPYCSYIFMKDKSTENHHNIASNGSPQHSHHHNRRRLQRSQSLSNKSPYEQYRHSSSSSSPSSLLSPSSSSLILSSSSSSSSSSSLSPSQPSTTIPRPFFSDKLSIIHHRNRRESNDNNQQNNVDNDFDIPYTGDGFEVTFEKFQHQFQYSYSPPGISHPVFIGIEIVDVDLIDDAKNFFSLQINLFQLWYEPRLNMTAVQTFWSQNVNPIPVNEANFADCLWTPSLMFEDSSESEKLLSPTTILLAYDNRLLLRTSRHALKVRCHMNLQIYPMDRHQCHFKLRTFTDPVHKVDLRWLSDPSSPNPGLLDNTQNRSVIHRESFTPSLFDISLGETDRQLRSWMNEQYTILDVEFIFERRIIHSLLTVYIPSSLVTVLSWLQFWFDVEAVPGRMSLGIMSTLTIMTQILTNYEKAGNHVTAVDIWLFVCLIMVFLALMEYAVAYTLSHYNDDALIPMCEDDIEKGSRNNAHGMDDTAMLSIERARTQLLKERNRLAEIERASENQNIKDSNQRPLLAKQLTFAGEEMNGELGAEHELAKRRVQTALDELDIVLRLQRSSGFDDKHKTKLDANNNGPAAAGSNSESGGAKKRKKGHNWSERLSSIRRPAMLKRQYSMPTGDGRSAGLSEVDYVSRYVFPVAFVVFALLYWITLIRFKLNM